MAAECSFSSFARIIHDDFNKTRPNVFSLLHHIRLDDELQSLLTFYSDRKSLYPLVFKSLVLVPEMLLQLPPSIIESVRSKETVLLLDDTCEGPPLPYDLASSLHMTIARLDIPPGGIVIANHNIDYEFWYNSWADEQSIKDRFHILYYHSWLVAASQQISGLEFSGHTITTPMFENQAALDSFLTRGLYQLGSKLEKRRFISMNYAARAHRVLLMLFFIRHGLLSQGRVSFGGLSRKHTARTEEFEIFPQWSYLKPFLSELASLGVMSLSKSMNDDGGQLILDFEIETHNNTAFSIVTETEFCEPRVRRITEKSLKPLLNLHPFVTLGLPGTLSMLRSLGFKTFDGEIDETYDSVADPAVRLELIFKEILRLCSMSDDEMQLLRGRLSATLIHNAEHMVRGLPTLVRDSLVMPALRKLEIATRK